MKRIIFLIAIMLSFLAGFSQVQDVRANRIIANQSVFVGTSGTYGRWVDTIYNDTTNLNSYVRSIPTNNAVYDFVVGRGNSLQTAINLKLNKTDTAAMLAGYPRRAELADTAASIRADFPGVLNGDKGDITVSGSGAVWTIDNDVVTYAKMQNVAASNRFLGRITSGSGNTEELTGAQATTLLDVFSSSLKGLAPASGGGTANFLRADNTWAVPPGGSGETNTASNLGGGLANYSTKVGVDLQFNSFKTADFNLASNLISLDYINSQMANNAQNGFMTSAYAAKLDTNHYIMNVGGGYEWAFQLSDTIVGMRTLVIISGGTAVQTDSTIELTIAGGAGGRFGVTGEDDEATESRSFQFDSDLYGFQILGSSAVNSSQMYLDFTDASNWRIGSSGALGDGWINMAHGAFLVTNLTEPAGSTNKMMVWDSTDFRWYVTAIPTVGGGGTVTDVLGTTNRITSTGGTTPDIDISATFEALLGKVANPLSQFAATTSAQLAGVLSDENGTAGGFLRGTSPSITTPTIIGTITTADPAHSGTTPSGLGVIGSRSFARPTGDFTLANSTSDQVAFGTTMDVWTLQGSTSYYFEGEYYLTHGAVSHALSMGFTLAGGASVTSINYSTQLMTGNVNTVATAQSTVYITQTASTAVNLAGANGTEYVKFSGWINVNAGGTFTPIIKFSVDPTGTCLMKAGSYLMFTPMGTNTVEIVGNVG